MDFPLIPSKSSHHPFREKTDLVLQPSPESSPKAQASSTQVLLINGFSPIGNSRYIDVEYMELADPIELSNRFLSWPDFRLRNAFSQYHNLSQRKQRKQNTVDLYI